MSDNLKKLLINRLKQVGAYDVRIADPTVGFEHVLEGMHPLEIWKQCKSVISFVIACPPLTNNTYMGPYAPWQGERFVGPVPDYIKSEYYAMDRLQRLFIHSITLKGMTLLQKKGYNISFSTPQMKLCAYEAGIGVYGRSGLIIHPILGNRIRIGAILTDAVLKADGRLEDFHPCENCEICIKMCPAKAFDTTKIYPQSYSREKCMKKREEITQKRLYCHNCYASCPAGKLEDNKLLFIKEAKNFYKTKKNLI